MVCNVPSLGLYGVQGYPVDVECSLTGGLPAFDIVGLPDTAVKESRERVRSAIKASGFDFPVSRITVNLAPADRRKAGTVYDLPILVGTLAAAGQLSLKGGTPRRLSGGAVPLRPAAAGAGHAAHGPGRPAGGGAAAVRPGGQRPRGHPGR